MLISFAIQNFRSIRDRQIFSMRRAPRRGLSKELERATSWRSDVSAVAAIYGSNAAGKSTLMHGLAFVVGAVEDSYRSWDDFIPVAPFLLDPDMTEAPTDFDIEFVGADGNEYQFGASFNASRVLREYLYVFKTNRRSVLYEREVLSDGDEDWYFGPSFRGPANQIRETTRPNALFLSAAAAANNATTRQAHHWITEDLRVYNARHYEAEHSRLIRRLEKKDQKYQRKILDFLRHADLGVNDVGIVREELDSEERAQMERVLRAANPDVSIEEYLRQQEFALSLSHKGPHGNVALPFHWESDGTKALISFASIAIQALEDGAVCIVDEIDSSLHPLLVAELVNIFSNPEVNKKQAQLIFTTHDVSLIGRAGGNAKTLSRDQVWVVEKDRAGATSVTGIAEYRNSRNEENLERGYMTGRYGGLPNMSIVHQLLRASDDTSEDA